MDKKFIFITGGVLSSLGKGITSASIAKLLELSGYKVAMMKFDPYLNVDPGTMSPYEHGEVYVTDDGSETDLDLGHYFRFSNTPLSKYSSCSAGQIYNSIITQERKGNYLGQTVQIIPHVTDEIKKQIRLCAEQEKDIDFTLVEIGGTVGDIESRPFLEAIRQFRKENAKNCINIHLTYIPYINASGEHKTKPTQHSVQELQREGVFADILICRSNDSLSLANKKKISLFCSVDEDHVLCMKDLKSTYEAPLYLNSQNITKIITNLLNLKHKALNIKKYETLIQKISRKKPMIKIAIVGKYLKHKDTYKSIFEALFHASLNNVADLKIISINSDEIKDISDFKKKAKGAQGILIPGGFGSRGWNGMILAAQFAREHKIPYFGICLGMHVMCVEFARNVLKLTHANSSEIDPITTAPVISLMNEQKNVRAVGASMRLGSYECLLKKGTKTANIYKKMIVNERHRHRFEFNDAYEKDFVDKGLIVSAKSTKGNLCEIVELKDHPWMIAMQAHPEFNSKIDIPHPLFSSFLAAANKFRGI